MGGQRPWRTIRIVTAALARPHHTETDDYWASGAFCPPTARRDSANESVVADR
jgi:hypothetical protein